MRRTHPMSLVFIFKCIFVMFLGCQPPIPAGSGQTLPRRSRFTGRFGSPGRDGRRFRDIFELLLDRSRERLVAPQTFPIYGSFREHLGRDGRRFEDVSEPFPKSGTVGRHFRARSPVPECWKRPKRLFGKGERVPVYPWTFQFCPHLLHPHENNWDSILLWN